MTEDEIRWVAEAAIAWNALVFILTGRYGAQPVLLPRRLYERTASLHQD